MNITKTRAAQDANTYSCRWGTLGQLTACTLCISYIDAKRDLVLLTISRPGFTVHHAICVECAEQLHIDTAADGPT